MRTEIGPITSLLKLDFEAGKRFGCRYAQALLDA